MSLPPPSLSPLETPQSPDRDPTVYQNHVLTTDQLLAILPKIAPQSIEEFSRAPSVSIRRPPAHTSSKMNHDYASIHPEFLDRVHPREIARFRKFLNDMSRSVSFDSELEMPFRDSSLTTEGDVTSCLESQVIHAAWEAVLGMVPPTKREYDLLTVRQFDHVGGVPDQVFGRLVTTHTADGVFRPCGVIEITGRDIVGGMRSVIDNFERGLVGIYSPDWVEVTKQLRKYACLLNIRDIIAMDQSCAIYFRFGTAQDDPEANIEFLLSTPKESGWQDPAGLTLRQLVAFLCWRGLEVQGVETQSFDGKGKGKSSDTERYTDIVTLPESPSQSRKRPGDGGGDAGRRVIPQRNTRGAGSREGAESPFTEWIKGEEVVLQLVADDGMSGCNVSRPVVGDGTFDSGFGEQKTSPSRNSKVHRKYRSFLPPLGETTVTFKVIRVITPLVAVLSSGGESHPRLTVAKLFGLHKLSPKLFANEVRVYHHCDVLQGCEIPYLYGVWNVIRPQGLFYCALLTEYIDPGITIASLVAQIDNAEDLKDRDEAIARLRRVRPSAVRAMQALHDCCVSHNDAYGRNMVLSGTEEQSVVIVDFDVAMVYNGEPQKAKCREWENWAIFRHAFSVLDD